MTFNNRRNDGDGAFSGNMAGRAIIDIGSNTVRLVVYSGAMRAPTVMLNEKVTARLGRDIGKDGTLAPEAIALAMRALRRFALLLEDLGVREVDTVATAAVREASNGPQFIAALKELGLSPRVLTGEEEAILSASGVAGAFPGARGIVADLGGGSLELVDLAGGEMANPVSLPLGALRLPDYRVKDDRNGTRMRKSLEEALKKGMAKGSVRLDAVDAGEGKGAGTLYLVGGTWRAMAVFAMQNDKHPLSDPHGLAISTDRAKVMIRALFEETPDSLKTRSRISSMRADKLPDAAILLQAMLAVIDPERIVFSSWGLREGLIFAALPTSQQAQDPLLAGVSHFAGQRGVPPMMATRIASWTLDAAPCRNHGSERLRLAATMLALASMRIEPNIRLPQAIEWALAKRWIALRSDQRAMLAAAISANGNDIDLPERVRALASDEALDEAINWGLSVRLARRMGAGSRRSLDKSRLIVEDDALVLRLATSHAALHGGPVDKDMRLLATRLGLTPRVDIVPDEALRTSD